MLTLRQFFIFVIFISLLSLVVLAQQDVPKNGKGNNVTRQGRESVSSKIRKWKRKTSRQAVSDHRTKHRWSKSSAQKQRRRHQANVRGKLARRHEFAPRANTKSPDESTHAFVQSETESPADDLEGALDYEFNMTKDPATGTIPDGIRERELAEAKEVRHLQQRRNTPELGSYNFVGPDNLGGRTRAIAYDIRFDGASNRVMLAGGISGGIYKSIDDGATWVRKSPIGDLFNVSALAQDTRAGSSDTWYYAGGEFSGNSASGSGASYRGKGVFKSTDNGETWTFLPASNTGVLEVFDSRADYVQRLVVDPTNGNVYMAALDAIYRSTDGGSTWNIVLTSGSSLIGTGMPTDIVVSSGGRLYAAFAGGSNTSPTDMPGVWTSTTGASGSWTRIAGPGGTPAGWNADGAYGRVVLAIAPSSENVVYALYFSTTSDCSNVAAPDAELFRWDNNTLSWANLSATLPDEAGCLNGNDPFAAQGGYDLVIAVKPDDPATIFIGGTNIYRSINTGATWTRIGGYNSPTNFALYPNSHPDIHSLVIQPTSTATMLVGDDGGIQRTTDSLAASVAWTQINSGYRTYQYYYVVNDPRVGNDKVIGGAQDNGTTRNIGGAGSNFESVFGGDGVSVGLTDLIGGTQFEYVGSQSGNITRRTSTQGSNAGTNIRPSAATASGLFVTLFKLDPDNTERLYYVNGSTLYRTTAGSTVTTGTWTTMTGVATSVGASSITALGFSRGAYNPATTSLFLGTSNGKVFRLDDPTGVAAGAAPVDITGANFPAGAVSSIAVSPVNDDVVLVTFSNYGVISVFWTGNANAATPTWTAVEGNLTLPSYRSSAIINTPTGLQYFVGTSVGLYSATGLPASPTWTQEGANEIGNSVVMSLDLRSVDNKLLVGTHGYGMWFSNFPVAAPALVTVDGRVLTSDLRGLRNATVTMTNSQGVVLSATTSSFGFFSFGNVTAGGTYTLRVQSRLFRYSPQTVQVNDNLTLPDFVGLE